MVIKSVLIEYENLKQKEIFTNSGLLFNKNYVLITSNVLISYLQQIGLMQWFSNVKSGVLNYDVFPTTNEPKLKVVTKDDNGVSIKNAKVVACFVCSNILTSSQKFLKDWAVDYDNKEFKVRDLLSLFFILKTDKIDANERQNLYLVLNDLLVRSCSPCYVKTGQEVFIESTAFGNRAFLNSYSQGVVTNMLGERTCFLLTDCSTTPGSEGSPVFLKTRYKKRFAIAIVISCLNWWKGEWIGLTLTANLVPLLRELVPPSYINVNIRSEELIGSVPKNLKWFTFRHTVSCNSFYISELLIDKYSRLVKFLASFTKSIVQVVCGTGWGTGILLSKEKGIFITNSHVIKDPSSVYLYWKNYEMKATIIYKTPNFDPFDVAVLQTCFEEVKKLEMTSMNVSKEPAQRGQEVFAAGFPLFPRYLMLNPSLTKGFVSQVQEYSLKTTATVLPGSSGGAILNTDGKLLGIIVSNTKMNGVGVTYPRINMAVPASIVYPVIERFLAHGDNKLLRMLHSNELSVKREWNLLPTKL
ncbi:hypothetical protein FQA39_LY04669 [Lamprigera yunnana]|nr:hypothetical protein FQA39_LY04669 [Lamprigera yunnana]